MSDWNEIKQSLREALIAAFNWNSLSAVLQYRCDRRPDLISSRYEPYDKNVDDVLANAVRYGWLEQLAEGALAANETHTGLLATVPRILAGVEAEGRAYYRDPALLINLYKVPGLPEPFLAREEELAALKTLVMGELNQAVAVTGRVKPAAVQGMGGIGKSVTAAALARDEAIREAFPDGILWLTFGREVDVNMRLVELIKALSGEDPQIHERQYLQGALTRLLADRKCLVVLDDVWQSMDARPFLVLLDTPSRLLISTRQRDVVKGVNAQDYPIDLLSHEEAELLLAQSADLNVDAVRKSPKAQEVVAESGRLPLALAMIGGMVRSRPNPWGTALRYLAKQDLARIRQEFPDYEYPNLFQALGASVDFLDDDPEAVRFNAHERYLDLAVLSEDTAVPLTMLQTFWQSHGLDDLDVRELAQLFVDRSLAQWEDSAIRLHDLQGDYVRQVAADTQKSRHQQLLEAYRLQNGGAWAEGPNDDYYFDHLAYHLHKASRQEELQALLLDFDWLMARTKHGGIYALISDYDYRGDSDRRSTPGMVQDALRLGGRAIATDPTLLAGQLLGRLPSGENEAWDRLRTKASAWRGSDWLRPRTPTIERPGGALKFTLSGHTDSIQQLLLTDEGRTLITGSWDGTVKVWDLASGQLRYDLVGHSGWIDHVLLVEEERSLVTAASKDSTAKVWDLATGQLNHDLIGHSRPIKKLLLTDKGRTLITASQDGTAKVWNLTSGELRHDLAGHSKSLTWLILVDESRALVTAAIGEERGKVWDLTSGHLRYNLDGHLGGMLLIDEGRALVTTSWRNSAKIWDLASGQVHLNLAGRTGSISQMLLIDEGRALVTTSGSGTTKVWDLTSGHLRHNFSYHTGSLPTLLLADEGRALVTAARDGTLKVWDLASGDLQYDLRGHTDWITRTLLTDMGKTLVTISKDSTIKVWDLSSGELRHNITVQGRISSVLLVNESHALVTAFWDGTIKIWNLATGHLILNLAGHTDPVFKLLLADEDCTLITGSRDGMVKVWDLNPKNQQDNPSGHSDRITQLLLSNEGCALITASRDGTAKIWDLPTGDLRFDLGIGSNDVTQIMLAYEDHALVTTSRDGSAQVWDVASGDLFHNLTGHSREITQLLFIDEDRSLITASRDGTAKVWDLASGDLRLDLEQHTGPIRQMLLAKKDHELVTASDDGTVKVWDLISGDLLHDLTISDVYGIDHLLLVDDGHALITCSGGYEVMAWDLASGELRPDLVEITSKIKQQLDDRGGDMVGPVIDELKAANGGRALVVADDYGDVAVWDLDTCDQRHLATTGYHSQLLLTDEGRSLVTVSGKSTIEVWNLASGDLRHKLATSDYDIPITQLLLAAEGRALVTASLDGATKVWDLASGDMIVQFVFDNVIHELAWDDDSRLIIAGDNRGGLHWLEWIEGDRDRV